MPIRARARAFVLIIILAAVPCLAADTVFLPRLVNLSANQETKVTLTLSDSDMEIESQKAGGVSQKIPYASVARMRFETVKRHRISEGLTTALVSPGTGLIIASTKRQDHWLAIDFQDGNTQSSAILLFDKKESEEVKTALTSKTGNSVELLDATTGSVDPTADSVDVSETLAFPIEKVAAAAKHGMDRVGCKVQTESPSSIRCQRHFGNSKLTGPGGEIVTINLESQGAGTQVRIVTKRIAVRNRNWSTPIYQDARRELGIPQ